MASLYTVLRGVKSAIATRLESIEPNRDLHVPFWERSAEAIGQRDVEDAIGRPRMFELGRAEYVKVEWIRSGVTAATYAIPIVIGYPDTEEWRDAAIDDFNFVGQGLRETPMSAVGLCVADFDMDNGPAFQDSDSDEWFTMTVRLLAICEAT